LTSSDEIGFDKSNEIATLIKEIGLKRVLISDKYPKILIINFLIIVKQYNATVLEFFKKKSDTLKGGKKIEKNNYR